MKNAPAAANQRPTVVVKSRILVVEDNARTRDALVLYLEHAGYEVATAANGLEGLRLSADWLPDLVVLDVMLPGLDGIDVCRAIRDRVDVPVILLTARATEEDKLRGLGCGADDYVTKPFSPRELVARIATVLRRARPAPRVLRVGHLSIDFASREVRRDGRLVAMTPAEFRLLEVLASSPGRAWTRGDLAARAFGHEYDALDRTIDAHVMHLRRKLERNRARPELIQTVFGIGYRFAAREEA